MEVVEAGTIMTLKGHLARYINRNSLEGYGPGEGKEDALLGNLVGMNELG